MKTDNKIDEKYTEFYSERRYLNVYPTEFVVRTFFGGISRTSYEQI